MLIQIGFTDAHSGSATIPNANHTFVIARGPGNRRSLCVAWRPRFRWRRSPGTGMKLLSYRLHQLVAGLFLVALLSSGANYMFEFGFFGRAAKAVAAMILLLFVIYATFFAPTRQQMREYQDVKRSEKHT